MALKYAQIEPGLPDHRKTRRLARRLEIPVAHAMGLVTMLMCRTAANHETGDLSGCDALDLAEYCGWEGDQAALVDALEAEGWLDGALGSHAVHGWAKRYEPVFRERERQRKRRARGTEATAEEPPTPRGTSAEEPAPSADVGETDRGPPADTGDKVSKEGSKEVSKRSKPRARAAGDSLSPNFDKFLEASDRRGDREAALSVWIALGYEILDVDVLIKQRLAYQDHQERKNLPTLALDKWIRQDRRHERFETTEQRKNRERDERIQRLADQAKKDWPTGLSIILDDTHKGRVSNVSAYQTGEILVWIELVEDWRGERNHTVNPQRLRRDEENAA